MLACRFWEVCIFSSSHTQEALLSLARHPSDRHEKNIQLDIYKMYRKYLYFIDNKKDVKGVVKIQELCLNIKFYPFRNFWTLPVKTHLFLSEKLLLLSWDSLCLPWTVLNCVSTQISDCWVHVISTVFTVGQSKRCVIFVLVTELSALISKPSLCPLISDPDLVIHSTVHICPLPAASQFSSVVRILG